MFLNGQRLILLALSVVRFSGELAEEHYTGKPVVHEQKKIHVTDGLNQGFHDIVHKISLCISHLSSVDGKGDQEARSRIGQTKHFDACIAQRTAVLCILSWLRRWPVQVNVNILQKAVQAASLCKFEERLNSGSTRSRRSSLLDRCKYQRIAKNGRGGKLWQCLLDNNMALVRSSRT